MKTILVPVDLSPATVHVCAAAATLAQSINASLLILHVIPPVDAIMTAYDMFDTAQLTDFSRAARKSTVHKLQALERWFAKSCPETSIALREGHAADVILRIAKWKRVDYIVMGSLGHRALYDAVVGSVAQNVSRSAPCPVMLVPITKQTGKIRKPSTPLKFPAWPLE
jgi:nucleotide-binding universal stress UspA family protein